ncbi:MAG TPA: PCRF domain-containing protein, partial [Vicinamibacteria bacterium]|nr:PCRF domain-containing protein [Vicinamibacteria bacterium]
MSPSGYPTDPPRARKSPCPYLSARPAVCWSPSLSASRCWGGIFDLDGLRHTVDRLTNLSLAEGFWNDQEKAQKMMRERSGAEDTLQSFEKLERDVRELTDLLEMAAAEKDEGMVADVAQQLPALEASVRALEMKRMLTPDDDNDAILSISAGAGGVDAEDWADILLRMYLRYCDRKGYKTELIDRSPGQETGISSASIKVVGPYAYGFLRAEHGVHRLIRVSRFSGRRETSFAAVKVVPVLDEITEDSIQVKDDEIRITVMRSGGAGGQHV